MDNSENTSGKDLNIVLYSVVVPSRKGSLIRAPMKRCDERTLRLSERMYSLGRTPEDLDSGRISLPTEDDRIAECQLGLYVPPAGQRKRDGYDFVTIYNPGEALPTRFGLVNGSPYEPTFCRVLERVGISPRKRDFQHRNFVDLFPGEFIEFSDCGLRLELAKD